jgi:hypothetical protein
LILSRAGVVHSPGLSFRERLCDRALLGEVFVDVLPRVRTVKAAGLVQLSGPRRVNLNSPEAAVSAGAYLLHPAGQTERASSARSAKGERPGALSSGGRPVKRRAGVSYPPARRGTFEE